MHRGIIVDLVLLAIFGLVDSKVVLTFLTRDCSNVEEEDSYFEIKFL